MNGIGLLQTLVNLYNEAVMNGVKSDSWTTKLDSLNLADSELVINEDEAIRQEFLEWVAMIIELDNYAFVDITEEAKSKLDKNKVQLSAFMHATYKKKSRGE